jgi:hypothetical protein
MNFKTGSGRDALIVVEAKSGGKAYAQEVKKELTLTAFQRKF